MNNKMAANKASGTLGTFGGVFTPSFLTILGIILFLRLGYVTGAAGLGGALFIVGLANAISIVTSLSLAAVATNLKVKKGGPYYIISRTLGHEFGGSIGIVLFIAQSISIAFYCLGFGEALAGILPAPYGGHPQLVAATAAAFLFVFAWLGADWATRFQYIVMVILLAALASFFIGGILHWDSQLLVENWSKPAEAPDFWFLFALFFPAVTGFTQGVNMSGDLKDPGVSVPLGTFLAVGISMLIYFAATVFLAASVTQVELMANYDAMNAVAVVPHLIIAGVLAATLSSAMASYLGAPRILQSIASDRLFSFLQPFAKGHGPSENPRRGVLLSTLITFATIAFGQLNLIAPVVSMFFLISYGLINYATYFEARAASPSFRPLFRYYHMKLSLVGALACVAVMMTIDFTSSLIALAVLFAIYEYLGRVTPAARWADGRYSYHMQRIRAHLLATDLKSEHPRDWRPNILLFVLDDKRRLPLYRFSSWLEANSGFTTIVKVLQGESLKVLKQRKEAEEELAYEIKANKLQAFPLALAAPNIDTGLHTLIQGFGIGSLHANTLLLSWMPMNEDAEIQMHSSIFGRHLKTAFRLGCNLVLLDDLNKDWEKLEATVFDQRRIDVWWWHGASSRLALLLAYLMTRTESWSEARIRLLATCTEENRAAMEAELHQTLLDVRIKADVIMVQDVNAGKIVEYSGDATLVFMPFRLVQNNPMSLLNEPLSRVLPALPVVGLVLAEKDFELTAEPEQGKAADTAQIQDMLDDARILVKQREKEIQQIYGQIEKKTKELEVLQSKSAVEAEIAKLDDDLAEFQRQREKTIRRAARAKARLKDAELAAEEAGLLIPEEPAEAIDKAAPVINGAELQP